MPRFVVLEHDWPLRHWDLFLEAGAVLHAWRLLAEPALEVDVPAEPNSDHRLLYLDYEGPLTGDRGRVLRWDWGDFDWIVDEPGHVVVALRGLRLKGTCSIYGRTCRIA